MEQLAETERHNYYYYWMYYSYYWICYYYYWMYYYYYWSSSLRQGAVTPQTATWL